MIHRCFVKLELMLMFAETNGMPAGAKDFRPFPFHINAA
jgi:hypothetical protein